MQIITGTFLKKMDSDIHNQTVEEDMSEAMCSYHSQKARWKKKCVRYRRNYYVHIALYEHNRSRNN